ncbi:MAG: CHAD domain-containing protein [Planctomycetota bacterium]
MSVTAKGTWIRVSPTSAAVADVAEQTLRLRLTAVSDRLPQAALESAKTDEHVHQLRVSCRRAAAALDAFRPVLGRGKKKMRRWLKWVRRAAGPARDIDVLVDRLRRRQPAGDATIGQLIDLLSRERQEAQVALVEAHEAARKCRLTNTIERCLQGIQRKDSGASQQAFATFAAKSLRRAAAPLMADFDVRNAPVAELHKLRIQGKRLRYSIELCQSALPKDARQAAYDQVEEIQDRLGRINDHASAQLRFQQMLADLPAGPLAALLAEMIVEEHEASVAAHGEFVDWWSPQRRDVLKPLTDPTAAPQSPGQAAAS